MSVNRVEEYIANSKAELSSTLEIKSHVFSIAVARVMRT